MADPSFSIPIELGVFQVIYNRKPYCQSQIPCCHFLNNQNRRFEIHIKWKCHGTWMAHAQFHYRMAEMSWPWGNLHFTKGSKPFPGSLSTTWNFWQNFVIPNGICEFLESSEVVIYKSSEFGIRHIIWNLIFMSALPRYLQLGETEYKTQFPKALLHGAGIMKSVGREPDLPYA